MVDADASTEKALQGELSRIAGQFGFKSSKEAEEFPKIAFEG